jgi:hypothetical protein
MLLPIMRNVFGISTRKKISLDSRADRVSLHPMSKQLDKNIRHYLSLLGSKGRRVNSPAQQQAARINGAKNAIACAKKRAGK